MKKVFQHHIDLRFIFTPFATTIWTIGAKEVQMMYIFGVRIIRLHRS